MRINPKQMEKAMKRMGMATEAIEADEVIIKTPEKDLVISNPEVTKINMMGQEMYQIAGSAEERGKEKFSDEDIRLIVEKTGATEEEAKQALEEEGDIAGAILKLTKS
jgi:nascent polypeptide-associated complex subunit alpha